LQDVTSTDVNPYLREITGRDVTAKNFRTWAAKVAAAVAPKDAAVFETVVEAKRYIKDPIERVASKLGNTPSICGKGCIIREFLSRISAAVLRRRRQNRQFKGADVTVTV
jgi:DNA topoisomerase-1